MSPTGSNLSNDDERARYLKAAMRWKLRSTGGDLLFVAGSITTVVCAYIYGGPILTGLAAGIWLMALAIVILPKGPEP